MGVRSTNPTQSFIDDFFRSGTDAVGPNSALPPASASGGDVNGLAPGNGYKYHTYTTTGSSTFVVSGSTLENCQIFVVGGGGSGGRGDSGGGGAGGIALAINKDLAVGTYPVTVGGGGAGVPTSDPGSERAGNDGSNSTFVTPGYTITGNGGGRGGGYPGQNGNPGGSGGGNRGHNSGTVPATQPSANPGIPDVTNYGNAGGGNGGSGSKGGGGGGAGGAGGNANNPTNQGGAGGAGNPFPQFNAPLIGVPGLAPLNGYFAGGGGGGSEPPAVASGGSGGGGRGGSGKDDTSPEMYGRTNSGGGSGGSGTGGGHGASFPAGSGIVIIRYPTS